MLKFNKFLLILADTTLSLDSSDISYKVDPNATFGDLINGLGGLQLNTPQRKCLCVFYNCYVI